MTYTLKQREALKLLHSNIPNILLFGGSRSGKTRIVLEDLVASCYTHPKVRHIVGRLHLSHARASLWDDTMKDVIERYPRESYILYGSDMNFATTSINKQQGYISFVGFDDQQRIEKILGRGANRIYLNESSQLSYDVFLLCKTRLSRRVEGITNKIILDANPPPKAHWLYKLFIEKRDPISGKDLPNPEDYACLRMNPADNLENLSAEYIKSLDYLPDYQRARFRDGEWVSQEGAIYGKFDETYVVRKDDTGNYNLPPMEKYSVGLDFGLNMAACLVGFAGDNVYLLDDYASYGDTTSVFNAEIYKRWKDIVGDKGYVAYCDPAGGERLQEVYYSYKADNDVLSGINYINTLIEQRRFFVKDNCINTLSEIYSYRWDDKGRPIKENDHNMDCMRYAIFTEATANNFQVIR